MFIVRHKVWKMKGTDHAQYPVRNVLLCRDSSIRIVSPMTGDIITTLLCPNKSKLIDAAYSIAESKCNRLIPMLPGQYIAVSKQYSDQ